MVEKLSIQIALDGGAEIERQLQGIGEAGTKAFADIAKSAEQAGGFKQLDPKDVTAKLQQMGVTGADAIGKIQAAVQQAGKLETLVAGIRSVEVGLKALAVAAIPIGAAVVAGMVAATKATIAFAAEITKVSEQAMRLGQGIEQFDRMRLALEGAGVSAQGVTGFMEKLGAAAEKANVGTVTKLIKELNEAIARGAGPGAIADSSGFKVLQQEAMKATESGRRVREEFEKLKIPIPLGAALTLQELVAKTGSAEAGLKAFVKQVRQMPSSLDANKASMDALGVSAQQLTTTYDNLAAKGTGAITPDMVTKADAVTGAVNKLAAAWTRFGGVTFAPLVVAEINTITAAIQALQNLIDNFSWGTFASAAASAGSALGWLTPAGLAAKGMALAFGEVAPAAQQAGQATALAGQQAVQAGQQGAQAGQTAASGFLVWDEALGRAVAKTNTVGTAATEAAGQVTQAGQTAASGFLVWDEALGKAVEKTNTLGTAATTAGQTAASAGQTAASGWDVFLQKLDEIARKAGALLGGGGGGGGGGAPGKASGGFIGGRGTGTSDSNLAWLSRGEYVMPARAVAQPGVLAFLEAMRRSGGIPGYADGGFIRGYGYTGGGGIADKITGWIADIAAANNDMRRALEQAMNTLTDGLFRVASDMQRAANAGGNARGGLLGGRGTGTSDSNLAWVSRGEHIMPASAVRQPGVLAFLEALRRSGGNLSAVLDGMGRFALGGMVPRAIPAFASGGGMSNVTIQFPGLPDIGGLRASSGAVDELRKAAALAQVRSGGRKPSRYS